MGAATAFLDFLCTPLLTLGVPLAVLIFSSSRRHSVPDPAAKGLAALLLLPALCWALGYGLLWASKWVIATAVLGWDVVGDALGALLYRTGADVTDAASAGTPLSAVARNLGLLLPGWAAKSLGVLSCALAMLALAFRRRLGPVDAGALAVLLIVALLPYLWYMLASNHSYIHYWFTYRSQAVSVMCLLFAAEMVFGGLVGRGSGGGGIRAKRPAVSHGQRLVECHDGEVSERASVQSSCRHAASLPQEVCSSFASVQINDYNNRFTTRTPLTSSNLI